MRKRISTSQSNILNVLEEMRSDLSDLDEEDVLDNLGITAGQKDRPFKLRPMIDLLNFRLKPLAKPGTYLSVDESIILFKGRSTQKQYNPMKPIKRGYKLWCLASMIDYVYNFDVYQEKFQAIEDDFGFGF
ncbi:hypothetical protein QYM36_009414 [Artemia franciscana]|uniref:PiggyBac transposable element-derived protein domain-containing protein n=1 Tax=Artemia franciscana TaxID=6661 RepID=A0AA88I1J6_ARTSF|nr:hypothetical protein QYM36_009414 [Artemia franciscana]